MGWACANATKQYLNLIETIDAEVEKGAYAFNFFATSSICAR